MENCDHQITHQWYPNQTEKMFGIVKCSKCKQVLAILPNNANAVSGVISAIQFAIPKETFNKIEEHLKKIEGYMEQIAKKQ